MNDNLSEHKITALVLTPAVKNYHWGKIGSQSLVARLIHNFNPELPYAELWYGSHPSGPATLKDSRSFKDLNSLITQRPQELLGAEVLKKYGPTLPFLTKILSINTALSIQTHPKIEHAVILNLNDPKNYPDANHKPEIAIALSDVKLLHGWISKEELTDLLKDFPALDNFLKKHAIDCAAWSENSKKKLVKVLYQCSQPEIAGINNLILKTLVSISNPSPKQLLFVELTKQFELYDVGLLLSLFLRLLSLKPREAIFTQPGDIHAYLSGELLECMANSDNVIRAGLTPKFQDVAALIEYANFSEGKNQPSQAQSDTKTAPFQKYFSAANEFEVSSIFKCTQSIKYLKPLTHPELLLLFEGEAKVTVDSSTFELQSGEAILISAEAQNITLELKSASIARICMPE